jgi:hypothetical protein
MRGVYPFSAHALGRDLLRPVVLPCGAELFSRARLSEAMMAERKGDRIVETTREARGAERGPTVRNVLVWSLGLVVVAMIVVWYVFFRT